MLGLKTNPEKKAGRLLVRALITALALLIIETLLLFGVLFLQTTSMAILNGFHSGLPWSDDVRSILRDCIFAMCMRVILGFTVANWGLVTRVGT